MWGGEVENVERGYQGEYLRDSVGRRRIAIPSANEKEAENTQKR